MKQEWDQKAQALARVAPQLVAAGLMRGWSGQLSTRFVHSGGYSVLLKRSGGSADDPTTYCLVDADGKDPDPADARPSLVTRVHCAIYASCPSVQNVIQCRGLYSDALATVLGEIPQSLETIWALKTEPVVLDSGALRSDTLDQYIERMAVAVSKAMANPSTAPTAVCVPFYGMWVAGTTVEEAVGRAIALEEIAKSAYLRLNLAGSLGLPKPAFPPWFGDMLRQLRRPGVL
jgi:ribulose-5-phosphate 4-epimerase/fuculose-1-phosphate aldolase